MGEKSFECMMAQCNEANKALKDIHLGKRWNVRWSLSDKGPCLTCRCPCGTGAQVGPPSYVRNKGPAGLDFSR